MKMMSALIFLVLGMLSVTNRLFAEEVMSNPLAQCLSLKLIVHNKSNQVFNIATPVTPPTPSTIQMSSISQFKPGDTTIINAAIIPPIKQIGYLSFTVSLGLFKSFYVLDPFNTYQGVFKVDPGVRGFNNFAIIINHRKMNKQSQCLFVTEADVSIVNLG